MQVPEAEEGLFGQPIEDICLFHVVYHFLL